MKLDLVLCLATAAYAAPTLKVKETVRKSWASVNNEVQQSLGKWDRSVDVFMSNVWSRLKGRGDVSRRAQEKWTIREAAVLAAFYGTAATGGVVGAGIIQSTKAKQENARYVEELAKSRSAPSTPIFPTETPIIPEETPITPAEIPLNE